MANKKLFGGHAPGGVKAADTTNNAGGKAYSMKNEEALTQIAVTSMFGDTFYVSAEKQLADILDLCSKVDSKFVAKLAVYAREHGYMKDTPAVLLAHLAARGDVESLKAVFDRVIDNGKMLRNFVQIVRSGVTGRKSLGSAPKKLVQKWLENASDNKVFRATVGNSPSMVDVIKMVHPKPKTKSRDALYGYLLGREYKFEDLPQLVQHFELFKKVKRVGEEVALDVPKVPFQMLTSLNLGKKEWTELAQNGGWHFIRMNLNNFKKYGVLDDKTNVKMIANKLTDAESIKNAKVFPYQLFTTYKAVGGAGPRVRWGGAEKVAAEDKMPQAIIKALHQAMELAVSNIPQFEGLKVVLCPDTSGSMGSQVSQGDHDTRGGGRRRQRKALPVTCVEVAGLVSSAVARASEDALILPFDTSVHHANIDPFNTVMTNAKILAGYGGGGTNCAAPLEYMNSKNIKADVVIYISDNESWYNTRSHWGSSTNMANEWRKFKRRNRNAKLICIDITPNSTVQTPDSKDVMNIGGFSDNVFTQIHDFVQGVDAAQLVGVINRITL